MPNGELIFAGTLVLLIWGVAAAFGWRQIRLLRKPASGDEANLFRQSARRRLFVTILLAVCGGFIALPYVTSLAADVAQIVPAGDNLAPEQKRTLQLYAACWVAIGLQLLLALCVIAYDMVIVKRFYSNTWQRLRDDRRAMLNRQIGQMREDRQEWNGYVD